MSASDNQWKEDAVFWAALVMLAALFIFSGCAPLTYNAGPFEVRQCGPTFYTYDDTFDPRQKEELRSAFAYFNGVLERKLWIDAGVTSAADAPVSEAFTRIEYVDRLPPNKGHLVCGLTTMTMRPSGCLVDVKISLSRECESEATVGGWLTALRHEVGHASGLVGHNEDPAGLMYWTSSGVEEVPRNLSDEEMEALISLYP